MALPTRLDDEPTLDDEANGNLDAEDKRAYRARTERMVVVPGIDIDGTCTGLYDVHSQSGKTYVVDGIRSRCDCPDMVHNAPEDGCKHLKRVEMMIEETSLPARGEDTAVYMDELESMQESLEQNLTEVREREMILERLLVALRESVGE